MLHKHPYNFFKAQLICVIYDDPVEAVFVKGHQKKAREQLLLYVNVDCGRLRADALHQKWEETGQPSLEAFSLGYPSPTEGVLKYSPLTQAYDWSGLLCAFKLSEMNLSQLSSPLLIGETVIDYVFKGHVQ